MKSQHILSVGIAALCFAQTASADVTIRITGSSAFRSATSNAIKNLLSSGAPQIAIDNETKTTSFTNATWQTFVGTASGVTGTVTIKTKWTGSVQGIQDTSAGNTIEFFPDTGLTFSASGAQNPSPTVPEGVPDIALADNTQGSTPYKTPSLNTTAQVGIVPFAFVASKDVSEFTNITTQQFKQLIGAGALRASVFSSNPTDTRIIFAGGRDPGSGTRLTTLAETGYGTLNLVSQYKIATKTGNTVNTVSLYPGTATVPNDGNDGEASGGGVATILRSTTASVTDASGLVSGSNYPGGFVGYLGENDSYNAVWGVGNNLTGSDQGNAHYLTYNGVKAFDGVAKKPSPLGTTAGLTTVTCPAGTTVGLVVGQVVTGTNIPAGSIIVAPLDNSASATSFSIDKTPTVTNSNITNAQIGSLLPEQIRNGAYTFWNYEYILWKSTVVTGDKSIFANLLKNEITNNTYSFSGLANDTAFKVSRTGDGKPVKKKTF